MGWRLGSQVLEIVSSTKLGTPQASPGWVYVYQQKDAA